MFRRSPLLHEHTLEQTCVCLTRFHSGAEEDKATAEAIKLEANDLFRRGKYNAAVEKYTEAITFSQSMHVLYVNRALCHRKLENWERCEQDSRTALGLHSGLMKVCVPSGSAPFMHHSAC